MNLFSNLIKDLRCHGWMIIIKLFQEVICTLRGDRGWRRDGGGTGMDERRRGAVSHRFEVSLQFMTRVGLRGTLRVKGG